MKLERLPGVFAVCRFAPDAPMPSWALRASIVCIARTDRELSIVAEEVLVPASGAEAPRRIERGWVAIRVAGQLDFALVGVLSGITGALAGAGIAIFVFSTFETDYILVKGADDERAQAALRRAGYPVTSVG